MFIEFDGKSNFFLKNETGVSVNEKGDVEKFCNSKRLSVQSGAIDVYATLDKEKNGIDSNTDAVCVMPDLEEGFIKITYADKTTLRIHLHPAIMRYILSEVEVRKINLNKDEDGLLGYSMQGAISAIRRKKII